MQGPKSVLHLNRASSCIPQKAVEPLGVALSCINNRSAHAIVLVLPAKRAAYGEFLEKTGLAEAL